jgi:hypothetical protein
MLTCREVQPVSAELMYLLLGDLGELLRERPRTEVHRAALLATLDRLIDILSDVPIAESLDDEFSDLLSGCPYLSENVELLALARRQDSLRLATVRNSIKSDRYTARTAERIVQELTAWMGSYCQHRAQERRLIQMAANRDVGGEA